LTEKNEIKLNGKTYHCALDVTMDYIGENGNRCAMVPASSTKILELKRHIPDITENVVVAIAALAKDGIVGRRVFAEVPPRGIFSHRGRQIHCAGHRSYCKVGKRKRKGGRKIRKARKTKKARVKSCYR
jgi:hypothetical protein